MNIDVVVGCQFGSEGKGMVAAMLAKRTDYDVVVSVNSAQAGHTAPYVVGEDRIKYVVTRHLPSACVTNHKAIIVIGAGAIINPKILIQEIKDLEEMGIPIVKRLYISGQATIISDKDIAGEVACGLTDLIGSTSEGVGMAVSKRASRTSPIYRDIHQEVSRAVGSFECLDDTMIMHPDIGVEDNILLEGSQGFGLSLYSHYYPYVTSRITTTAAFLAYAELPLHEVRHVYGVYRTFPIRVGGNSGPMYKELEWKDVDRISGYKGLGEHTTVTGRLRRVGCWDSDLAMRASIINGVTRPVITFVNYLDRQCEDMDSMFLLPMEVRDDLHTMETDIGMPIWGLSTSRSGGWII